MALDPIVRGLIEAAETHRATLLEGIETGVAYYEGRMPDIKPMPDRSSMVTRDVRTAVRRVLPSLTRTIFGGQRVVEYEPVGPGDEAQAEQATDYVNEVILAESGADTAIRSAIHDALVKRNGILRWWYAEERRVSVTRHSGLDDAAFVELAADPSVEVMEHSERQEAMPDGSVLTVHDCRLRRVETEGRIRAAAVPRENFLIHPDALSIEEALVVGEATQLTRSELIAMGYDRDTIDVVETAAPDRVSPTGERSEVGKANELIDYYDLFIRTDADDDGIAELRHMCLAGPLKDAAVLLDEECDEAQYADLAVIPRPHEWQGDSLFDELGDIQKAKTALLRQTLDNLYWQNAPQIAVQPGAIKDMDAILSPKFGRPIEISEGRDPRMAIQYMTVPFVAAASFPMMEYMDREAQGRTGISEASGGMDADALQNVTAKATAMIEQQGIGQAEVMVRSLAVGLRRFFRGLLRAIIRHQDRPRTVRLRDGWVDFDPRDWNAAMDCTVNTGLGAGTRERDLMIMQQVIGLQDKLFQAFGQDNPFVSADNVYAAISRIVEAAGLKSPDLYFTKPDPEEVRQRLEAARNAPSPEQQKAQLAQQIEEARIASAERMKQAEMMAARDKEKAQMEADLIVAQQREAAKAAEIAQMREIEREKLAHEVRIKAAEIDLAWDIERLRTLGPVALPPSTDPLDGGEEELAPDAAPEAAAEASQ